MGRRDRSIGIWMLSLMMRGSDLYEEGSWSLKIRVEKSRKIVLEFGVSYVSIDKLLDFFLSNIKNTRSSQASTFRICLDLLKPTFLDFTNVRYPESAAPVGPTELALRGDNIWHNVPCCEITQLFLLPLAQNCAS